MKCIYVAHPYQGKMQNKEAITHICQRLTKLGVMPVSPIHAFGFLHDNIPSERHRALEFCEELLTMSDELWLFGEWEKSDGCVFEKAVALTEFKTIRIVTGWIAGQNGYTPLFNHTPKWLKADAKKPSAPTESPKENSHLDCTIDVEKAESLVDFPLIPVSPECKRCDCFTCVYLFECYGDSIYCKTECRGTKRTYLCPSFEPRNAENIMKRGGVNIVYKARQN